MSKATFYFPKDFRWGTATSSHQVEGNNVNNDWWAWEQEPGRILDGTRSGLACNWWENAEEDLDRAAEMGTNAHRLSIEWSRVEPQPGLFDEDSLDRYRQILLALHERDIEPMVTLHHFSNPLWLAEKGGWEKEDVVTDFQRYVRVVVERLGDLVPLWVTINEPMVYSVMAYLEAKFPPGRSSLDGVMRVARNMLLGHAAAYHAIHELRPEAQVGIARQVRIFEPSNPRFLLDRQAARILHYLFNQNFNQALITGRLRWPLGRGRIKSLAHTFDFIGLNYYTRDLVSFSLLHPEQLFMRRHFARGAEVSDNNYSEIYPQGLFQAIKLAAMFKRPIYITENGLPDADDDQRPGFILRHLRKVWATIQFNNPVMGYYFWSLVDNFEWERGWVERFGLIELDTVTQERKLRRSGELYGRICRNGCIDQELVAEYAPVLLGEMFPG
jgi:beta-glucosidase